MVRELAVLKRLKDVDRAEPRKPVSRQMFNARLRQRILYSAIVSSIDNRKRPRNVAIRLDRN
jgi:hypothetical protein